MLYLRNTNQQQTLDRGIARGPIPGFSSISASYTANSSSLFVLLSNCDTKLSTTSSATTNFSASNGSVISASAAGGNQLGFTSSVFLSISASDGSYFFTGSSTGSKVENSFNSVGGINYTISSSFSITSASANPTGTGLYRTQYNGYFAGVPSWFDTATPASVSANGPNTGSINPGFTGSQGQVTNVSVQWLGYFTPTTTEDYTFYAITDDAMFMWIGNDAINNYTTSSKNIGEPGLGPLYLTGSVISLTSGSYYPMRIQFGEAGGGEYLSMSYSTPTISQTYNWSSNMYYNTSSNGF